MGKLRSETRGVRLQIHITIKSFCQSISDLIDNNSEMFLRKEILQSISTTALFSYQHLLSQYYNTFLAVFHATRHLLFKFTTASRMTFGSYHSFVKTDGVQFAFMSQLILLSVACNVLYNLAVVHFSFTAPSSLQTSHMP